MSSKSRILGRVYFRNVHSRYHDLLIRKKLSGLNQWTTPVMARLTSDQFGAVTEIEHMWKTGDRFYKLAHEYYGNPEYWWVIARYNQTPTEGHIRLGTILFIPTPINTLLDIL